MNKSQSPGPSESVPLYGVARIPLSIKTSMVALMAAALLAGYQLRSQSEALRSCRAELEAAQESGPGSDLSSTIKP